MYILLFYLKLTFLFFSRSHLLPPLRLFHLYFSSDPVDVSTVSNYLHRIFHLFFGSNGIAEYKATSISSSVVRNGKFKVQHKV